MKKFIQNGIIYLYIILLISACGTRQSDNLETVSNRLLDIMSYIDTASIINIPLETNADCIITRIELIRVTEKYIFVVNNHYPTKKLYMFTRKGEFIRQIGEIGNGHGEYIKMNDFALDEKKEEIFIDTDFDILRYSFTGKFIEAIPIPDNWYAGSGIRLVNDSLFIIARAGYIGAPNENHRIIITNKNGTILKQYIPQTEYANKKTGAVPTASNFFSTNNNGHYCIPNGSNMIYHIDKECNTKKLISICSQEDIMRIDLQGNEWQTEVQHKLCPISDLCVNDSGIFVCHANYSFKSILFLGTMNNGVKYSGVATSHSASWPGIALPQTCYRDYFVAIKPASTVPEHISEQFPYLKPDDNPVIVMYKYNFQ